MAIEIALLAVAACGHVALWAAFANHVEATALPRGWRRLLSGGGLFALVGVPIGLISWSGGSTLPVFESWPPAVWVYLATCWISAMGAAWWFAVRSRPTGRSCVVRSVRVECRDLRHTLAPDELARGWTKWIARLPGNEIFQLEFNEIELAMDRLPPALDGLRMVHLSDLHIAGRIGKPFFDAVVARINGLQPDLVAITGDLIDDERYLSWLPATLGQLETRHGVFYVLGNHDTRVDLRRLRLTLSEAGLTDVGGTSRVVAVRDAHILLAGNELPWIVPAAAMRPVEADDEVQLRVLLAHSPDQFAWARHYEFDLMLAGHTHGGQIRLPLWGAVANPSRHGMEYASGVFYMPPTILHVSRGVSALLPIRWNCRPEVTLLVLRSPVAAELGLASSRAAHVGASEP